MTRNGRIRLFLWSNCWPAAQPPKRTAAETTLKQKQQIFQHGRHTRTLVLYEHLGKWRKAHQKMKNCSTVWVVTSIVIRSRHGVLFRHSLMFLLKPLQKQGKCHAFYNWRVFTVTKCSTHNENSLRHCWESVIGHPLHRWDTTDLIYSFTYLFVYLFIYLFI